MSSTHHRNHIVTLLENLAREHPALPLYTFLDAAQKSVAVLTSSDLLRKATQIAGLLQGQVLAGKPVLVLSPHGPAFLESLFGVMLAGCVPVPVTFSRRLGMANIADIIADTGVEAVLGPKKTLENLRSGRLRPAMLSDTQHQNLLYLASDPLPATDWCRPQLLATDVALIYPGLLSDEPLAPVALSHSHLLTSVDRLIQALGPGSTDSLLTSLDLADGMALLLHVLLPVRLGLRSYFLPLRQALDDARPWLQAASRLGCTIISAPPAVLSLAAHDGRNRSDFEPDLSALRSVCVGGDHVAPGSVLHFIERYQRNGMSAEKLFSCYGLSAVCSFISGRRGFKSCDIDGIAYLSLGVPDPGLLALFDTGDRLLQSDNELYCRGRCRHRFSQNGFDFQAEDIESFVLQVFGARGLSRCVVLHAEDSRQTVLLAECATRQLAESWQGVVSKVMERVLAETGCELDRVLLLRPGSLPLSVSGMVLRKACAVLLEDGSLMLRLLPVRGK